MMTIEVVIPWMPAPGRPRTSVARIDFHVDTAADVTAIGRLVFTRDLGLSIDDAYPGLPTTGIGASMESRVMRGFLFFDHEDGSRSGQEVDFVIPLTDNEAQAELCVLGLDVLLRGRLTLDRANVTLDLPVVPPAS